MSCPSHQQFEYNRESNNAILDTGTTGHFGLLTTPCTNIHKTKNSISVNMPNGSIIQSTHTVLLPLNNISKSARVIHLLPNLNNTALISISQLCDDRCSANFHGNMDTITKNNIVIMKDIKNENEK